MNKRLKNQQLEYIKNFLLVNRYKKSTGGFKILLTLVVVGIFVGIVSFIFSGKEKVLFREKGYLKKEERKSSNFNKGENLDGEDAVDGKVYLLKKDRVEVQAKSTGLWKTYPIPIEGTQISVTKDKIAILSKNGELHIYDKNFKKSEVIYSNLKSKKFKSIEEIKNIYSFGEKIFVQGEKDIEIYNLKNHGWENSPFEFSKLIKKHIKIMNYDVYITDYGIAYFDGKDLVEKKFEGIKDIGGVSLDGGYVLTEKGELYKVSLTNSIQKIVLLKDTKYEGKEIKQIDLSNEFIVIKDSLDDIYRYDTAKREWKKIESSVKKFLISGNDVVFIKEKNAVIYNLVRDEKKNILKKVIEVYSEKNKFIAVVQENEKTALLEISFDDERYIVGKGQYKGELKATDEFYFYEGKIFVLNSKSNLQYYDLELKEWFDLKILLDSKVKRVRESKKSLFILTDEGSFIKYSNEGVNVQKNIKSFEIKGEDLYLLDKDGVLSINAEPKKFMKGASYSFDSILGVVKLDKLYVIFKKGVEIYNLESGTWTDKKDFLTEIKEYSVIGDVVLGYAENSLQELSLKNLDIKSHEIKGKILSGKESWILSEDESKTYIYTFKNGSLNEKILSSGVPIEKLSDISSVEKYDDFLYVTTKNILYRYKDNIWEKVWSFNGNIKIIGQNTTDQRLYIEEAGNLYVMKDNKFEHLATDYKKVVVLANGVVLQNSKNILYIDSKTLQKNSYFNGELKINGDIRNTFLLDNMLLLTDNQNLHIYNRDTYSWKTIFLGEREQELIDSDRIYFLQNQRIKTLSLKEGENLKIEDLKHRADKIWIYKTGKLLHKFQNKLYLDGNEIMSRQKMPILYGDIKEFEVTKGDIFGIYKDGYIRYNLAQREWFKKEIPNIIKNKIFEDDIYTLTSNGVYKNGEKILSENNISDFVKLGEKIVYIKNNRIVGIEEFSGDAPINNIDMLNKFVEVEEFSIFTFKNQIYVYDSNSYSWKKIEIKDEIKRSEVIGKELYVTTETAIYSYLLNGSLNFVKDFKHSIKDFKVESGKLLVLIENSKGTKELNMYNAKRWETVFQTQRVPFNFENIIEIYNKNNKNYFLTTEGVFIKDDDWKIVLNYKFTNARFEEYEGALAVVTENKLFYLNEASKAREIQNYSYYKSNGQEYYLEKGTLFSNSLRNTLPNNFLENTYTSFNVAENYYYITSKGIARYNFKTHSWEYKESLISDMNNYRIIQGEVFVSSKNGIFKFDLTNLKTQVYLKNKDVLDSNPGYAVVNENNRKILYEFKNGNYISTEVTDKNVELDKIEAVDLKDDILKIYTPTSIYEYIEKDNILKNIGKNDIKNILSLSEYKQELFIYGAGKMRIGNTALEALGYSKTENELYFVAKDGLKKYGHTESELSTLKGVYSNEGNMYFTSNGTYEYNSEFGIYYKVDDQTKERLKKGNIYIERVDDEILIYQDKSLKDKIKIEGGKVGFNINGLLKVFFKEGQLESFKDGERIATLKGLKDKEVYFETTLGEKYSYNLENRKVFIKELADNVKKDNALAYRGSLRAVFLNGVELILVSDKGNVLILDKESLKLRKPQKKNENLVGIKEFFQEGSNIYIKTSKGVLRGKSLETLEYDNNYKGNKKSIELSLNSLNNLNYKVSKNYSGDRLLIANEDINEKVFEKSKLKIKIPKEIVLNDSTYKEFYTSEKSGLKSPERYYYLKDSNMVETFKKQEFMRNIYELGFVEDRIISISNNPDAEVYFMTLNKIYTKDYKIVYSGTDLKRVNVNNNILYVESESGVFALSNSNLKRTTTNIDPKNAVLYDGVNWKNIENVEYKIDILNSFRDRSAFRNRYFVHESFEKINSVNRLEISNGDYIFKFINLDKFNLVEKDSSAKKENKIFEGKTKLRNILTNPENNIVGIEELGGELYILSKKNLFKLKNHSLLKTKLRVDSIKRIATDILAVVDAKKYLINRNGEIEREISSLSKNSVVIQNEELRNEISEGGDNIKFDTLKNSEVFRNGYFIFDDMTGLDYKNGYFYREYKNIAHKNSEISLGELVEPIKKQRYITKIAYNSLGDIQIIKNEILNKEREEIHFEYEDKKRNTLTYNTFKDIDANKSEDSLYLLGETDSYKVNFNLNSVKFDGRFKDEFLIEKRSNIGTLVTFENTNLKVEASKKAGIDWKLNGVSSNNLWIKQGLNTSNFVFAKHLDFSSDLELYTDGRFIFNKNQSLRFDSKSKGITKIERHEEEVFFVKNNKSYNSSLNEIPLKMTPFIKKSLDLSDGNLKIFSNNALLINYAGSNVYGDKDRLRLDENLDLKLDTDNEMIYLSRYGTLKRDISSIKILDRKSKLALETYGNRVLIKNNKVQNEKIEGSKTLKDKILHENYNKKIIQDGDFVWNRPRKILLGDSSKISNSSGDIWNIRGSLDYIGVKKIPGAQEILYKDEIYLYDRNKIKSNLNLDINSKLEELDINILRHIKSENLGIILKDSKWRLRKNSKKIELDGIEEGHTFIDGKLNYDYMSGLSDEKVSFSNMYLWDIESRKLIKKLSYEIEDVKKIEEKIYLKANSKWQNLEGEQITEVVVKAGDKWKWILDIQDNKVLFENNILKGAERKFLNNQFTDDIILNVKGSKKGMYLFTPVSLINYNTEVKEIKEYLDEAKEFSKTYVDKKTNQLEFEARKVPLELEDHQYIDYYEKFGIYHLIKSNGIELVNKKRGR